MRVTARTIGAAGNTGSRVILQHLCGECIYVVNAFTNNVFVFNSAQGFVTKFLVGRVPQAISISPDGSRVYVVDSVDNNVAVHLGLATTFIHVGPFPEGIAITQDGAYAYVTNGGSSSVSVIATATNQVVKPVILLASGSIPNGIAITPDGNHAYVTKQGSNDVSVIDTANLEVTGAGLPIPVGATPGGIAITPDGNHAYVANIDSDSVSVIDTGLNQVVQDPIPVGKNPFQISHHSGWEPRLHDERGF
jgi:YVTN family beta-propeller protein